MIFGLAIFIFGYMQSIQRLKSRLRLGGFEVGIRVGIFNKFQGLVFLVFEDYVYLLERVEFFFVRDGQFFRFVFIDSVVQYFFFVQQVQGVRFVVVFGFDFGRQETVYYFRFIVFVGRRVLGGYLQQYLYFGVKGFVFYVQGGSVYGLVMMVYVLQEMLQVGYGLQLRANRSGSFEWVVGEVWVLRVSFSLFGVVILFRVLVYGIYRFSQLGCVCGVFVFIFFFYRVLFWVRF